MKIGDLLWLLPPLIQKVWKLWNWSFLKSIDKKVKLWQSHQKALASTATAMSWDCKLPKSWHFPLDDKVALEARWGCSLCQARVGGCWEAEPRFTSNVPKSEQAAPQLQSFLPHSVETSDCHRRRQQLSWDCRVVTPIVANSNCGRRANTKFASRIVLRDNITTFLFTLKNWNFMYFVLTFIIAAYCATDFKFAPQLIRFISFYAECPLLPPVKSHSARGGSKRREWIFLTCQMTMWSKVIVS